MSPPRSPSISATRGKRVLLLMDSVTRFARALREIGLAAGEPPTRRGFPPWVFATLPQLMERAGMYDKGSITALYTVLVEGDDMTEPVADETRSILDGHIVLSRKLGAANHYPAVDVLASASRVMNAVITPQHKKAAGRVRELMAKYAEIELLIKIGEYKPGSDPLTDEAVKKNEAITAVPAPAHARAGAVGRDAEAAGAAGGVARIGHTLASAHARHRCRGAGPVH